MQKMVAFCVGFFVKRGYLLHEQRETAAYGFDLLLYTLFSTGGLLLTGMLLGRGMASTCVVGIFYLNQTVGGGFHASTHLRCLSTMLFFLLIGLFVDYRFPIVEMASALLALLCLFGIPLVLHPNKQYLDCKRQVLIRRSRLITFVESAAYVALFAFIPPAIRHAITTGLGFSALSRIVGYLKRR